MLTYLISGIFEYDINEKVCFDIRSQCPGKIQLGSVYLACRHKKDTISPNVTKAIFKLIRLSDAIAIDTDAYVDIVTRYFSRYFVAIHEIEPLPYLSLLH
jgi:hypothetical protein